MRLGFQQNDLDSSTGLSLSGSFRKSTSVFGPIDDASPGQSLSGSFRKSSTGFQQHDLDLYAAQILDGSFRESKTGVCKGKSGLPASNNFSPLPKRACKAIKDYTRNLVEPELFTQNLEDWILENSLADSNNGEHCSFNSPFLIDELRQLDFALEATSFQQLFRMPTSFYSSSDLKEDEYFALEDFLHTMANGLWRTFWHKKSPLPFLVSCTRHPRSRLYSLDKAISKGRVSELSGAALVARVGNDANALWDQVVQCTLFKSDIMLGNKLGISSNALSEALFYGFHMLVSRRLSKQFNIMDDSVFILVLDSKVGAVVKLRGDLRHLELELDNPYQAVTEWIKLHCEVSVSPVDRIWNKLGNANWGDFGTLQLLLATFYSIAQFGGPPRRSIASLASDHSLRLQKRRIECHIVERESGNDLPSHHYDAHEGETVELEHDADQPAARHQSSHWMLHEGDLIQVDDQQQGEKSFQILEPLVEEKSIFYSAVSLENPSQLLTLYVGAHPSRLEPSWEDMSLWYQVQRQTKVLNILRQAGISSKYLPEIISSGRMLHPGNCRKQSPGERCDHPWCGTPVLVTHPIGEPLSSIAARDGPFSSEEATRCCRDCLSALGSARTAHLQHGDICPENVVRVSRPHDGVFYVPISWGRAVLEERDSPAMNLLFSSSHALQHGKLCPSSDVESLVYLLYFLCGGNMQQQQDSIESALQWRQNSWAKRSIQKLLGEVSPILKAFADYVDTLCGTPYPVDYDGWVKRLDRAVDESGDKGKMVEDMGANMRFEDVAGSSGVSEGGS